MFSYWKTCVTCMLTNTLGIISQSNELGKGSCKIDHEGNDKCKCMQEDVIFVVSLYEILRMNYVPYILCTLFYVYIKSHMKVVWRVGSYLCGIVNWSIRTRRNNWRCVGIPYRRIWSRSVGFKLQTIGHKWYKNWKLK